MKKLSSTMVLVSDFLEKIIEGALSITIFVVLLTVVIGVMTRNINFPIVWLGELGTFSCIWAIYLGMALAYRKDMFPNVDIFHGHISKKTRFYMSISHDILILFFLILVLWSSRVFLSHLKVSGQISPEMRLPMVYAYLGPVIGYIFTSFFCLTSLVGKIEKIIPKPNGMEGAV